MQRELNRSVLVGHVVLMLIVREPQLPDSPPSSDRLSRSIV